MQSYAALDENHENDEEGGVLVHTAEPSRTRWNHIEDLDTFFARMYQYHQEHGFVCMFIKLILQQFEYAFIILLTSILVHGVDYKQLFGEPPYNTTKIHLKNCIHPLSYTFDQFTITSWAFFIIALLFWTLKLTRSIYHLFYFYDIKQFFNCALKIVDSELDNLTWHDIQTKVKAVQIEQQMCIHKRELTELDIYHRILRQNNYMIAMVNKRLLPPRLSLPFLKEWVYFTPGLKLNIQLLFFWSPWSAFEHPWQLREEYRKSNLRHELATQLGRQILYLALANLVLSPLIFVWQLLYAFYNYASLVRREPALLVQRRWSLFGRYYLRHFNELEHELQARLTRGHKCATKYMEAFVSPIGELISQSLGFYAAALLSVAFTLAVIDESFLNVDPVIMSMTGLGILVAVLMKGGVREITTADLDGLLKLVWLHTHYLPTHWEGQAHTTRVRTEFEQLYQYTFVTLLEDILSPLLTPYILIAHVYPKRLEFVDFFRSFTVSVVGVGDVCSFAQMNVRKHGHPDWHEEAMAEPPDQYSQCEDGKVELSLVHFKCTNPSWRPPEAATADFVENVMGNSVKMVASEDLVLNRPIDESLRPQWRLGSEEMGAQVASGDVPLYASDVWRRRVPAALHRNNMWSTEGPNLNSIVEMNANANYLLSVHQSRVGERGVRVDAAETTPLLFSNR